MKKVAVENKLSYVGNYLKNNGFDVKQIDTNMKYNSSMLNSFDAVVISGISEDFMGMQDTLTSTPIIKAEGMTLEEIKSEIGKKVTK